jgi:hypothetical protein
MIQSLSTCTVCMLRDEALVGSYSLQTPTSTSASHAMPCYSARPFVRGALTSCSCMMHAVLDQPWRSGESKSTKCTRGACRMGARAVSGFALSAALQTVECLRLTEVSGKWEVEGERIPRYRAGRFGDGGRRGAMGDGLLISVEMCWFGWVGRRLKAWREVLFACCAVTCKAVCSSVGLC